MQIDLGADRKVTGFVIQGRGDYPSQWITSFTVQYFSARLDSNWSSAWWDAEKGPNGEEIFRIKDTTKNTICLDVGFTARYVRFHVGSWNGWPSMRAGVLVEPVPQNNVPKNNVPVFTNPRPTFNLNLPELDRPDVLRVEEEEELYGDSFEDDDDYE